VFILILSEMATIFV